MSEVRLPQLAWHGPRELELPLPDDWQVEICHMAGFDQPALKPEEIQASIAHPLGLPPLRELARGRREVVILFDDLTRVTRVAKLLPFVLSELAEAGLSDGQIRLVAALGCHGAMSRLDLAKKLGEAVLARFPVYNHNPFDNCDYVGTTRLGTKLFINQEVMSCDLKIGIGSIVPHPLTGFGGGGKIVLPGVSSLETTEAFHRLEAQVREKYPDGIIGMGRFAHNPLRREVEEAAKLASLDVKIDCLVNEWGEPTSIFAGALELAYAAGVQRAKEHYLSPRAEDKDVVLVNSFAKASEAIIALEAAFPAVSRQGGDVVLICNAPEGQVVHYLIGSFGRKAGSRVKVRAKVPRNVNHLIVYTQYPELAARDNPQRCEAVGVNVRRHQLVAIVIAAFFAGVAGVLFVVLERSVFPDLLFWILSLEIFIMCLLGGWFTFTGPILGAAIMVALRTFVGQYTEYWTLILGVILILLIFFLPQGVMGYVQGKLSPRVKEASEGGSK